MLKDSDEEWLAAIYPTMIRDGDAVGGIVEFTASYSRDTNRFLILDGRSTDDSGAVTLAGNFKIRIEERRDKSTSQLPALWVEGIEPIPDRHFSQRDNSACLCSPLEEFEFVQPEFHFRPFLERLVIPFLYGQIFYSSRQHWPWAEYAHGATGILEAYCKALHHDRLDECLRQLRQDPTWPRIQSALRQEPHVKGHTPCFCSKMDQIRRCHPIALEGALRLQHDLKTRGIPIA
jgi:hypothetical protein